MLAADRHGMVAAATPPHLNEVPAAEANVSGLTIHLPMIELSDRGFCFTGKLADLKRSQAEREARGAHTTDVVNERLHFLVVGSIPSTG